MNIAQLIETLEDIKEQVGENTEVRFASQPNWPFEYSIRDVHPLTKEERRDRAEEELRDQGMGQEEINEYMADNQEGLDGEDVVYLEEGSQLGYLPDEAREILGW
jgi:hypothetical protein